MQNYDEEIKKVLVDRLCENNQIDASSINVKVENNVIELRGSVSSHSERELCAKIAHSIPRVGKVQNHIAVIEDPGTDPKSHIA
jgi:osmotically-inducible protein OsmY